MASVVVKNPPNHIGFESINSIQINGLLFDVYHPKDNVTILSPRFSLLRFTKDITPIIQIEHHSEELRFTAKWPKSYYLLLFLFLIATIVFQIFIIHMSFFHKQALRLEMFVPLFCLILVVLFGKFLIIYRARTYLREAIDILCGSDK